ncbi:MAG TPA: NAD(P)H-hydrate epimerase, partial [Candidatus Thermoplasmatota archaeon]|nr:NAD(P)H-hydrate epimerase [Candidatus Thermoplasmatota archaeon]
MKALPVREFRRLDRNSEELGVPLARLMANAGKALARAVARRLPKGGEALFLCGKGNNGGDGLAAAALLHRQGKAIRVVLAEGTVQGPGRAFLQQLPPGTVERWNGRNRAPHRGVLVDCLLGSGLEGAPRRPYDAIIRFVNRHRARLTVVSCDVPSGFGTTLAVHPHVTVTFHAAKEGMSTANSGRIEVARIGIPSRAAEVGLGDLDLGYVRPA